MLRVLVVDNDPAFIKSLRRSLSRNRVPVDICEALSGKEAIGLLADNEYDALTLDMDMPGMDGLRVLDEVRELYPKLPVLMLTFLPEEDESVSRALRLGADGYLYKWKSRTDLLPAIERIVADSPCPQKRLAPPPKKPVPARA
jgi:CheY-like chemotaxis protein